MLPCGFVLSGHAYHRSDIGVADCKSVIGRLPQTLIEPPKAFLTQPFLRLGREVAIANNVDYALYACIIHFDRHCRTFRVLNEKYAAFLGAHLGRFF
jgi:hypothetical protein